MKKSKLILIDEKMNTVEIEVNTHTLKAIGVEAEKVKKHKSRRKLFIEITEYLESFKKNS